MGLDKGGHGRRARTTGSRLPPSAHGRPSTMRRPAVIKDIVVAGGSGGGGGHALTLQLAMLASLPSASSSSKEEDDVR